MIIASCVQVNKKAMSTRKMKEGRKKNLASKSQGLLEKASNAPMLSARIAGLISIKYRINSRDKSTCNASRNNPRFEVDAPPVGKN